MTDTEWLASLKVGDEVAVKPYGMSFGYPQIKKIDSITKTGRIVIDGSQYINGRNRSSRRCLRPVTNKLREEIKRQWLVNSLCAVKWKSFDTSRLEQIAELAGIEVRG